MLNTSTQTPGPKPRIKQIVLTFVFSILGAFGAGAIYYILFLYSYAWTGCDTSGAPACPSHIPLYLTMILFGILAGFVAWNISTREKKENPNALTQSKAGKTLYNFLIAIISMVILIGLLFSLQFLI